MTYTPVLRKEVVDVAPLGEVVVRMLKLSERLALGTGAGSHDTFAPRLLAAAVTTKEGEPLFDVEQWDIFGAEQTEAMNKLLDVALRLSGMDGDAPKNG